jgi:hypothetical protein
MNLLEALKARPGAVVIVDDQLGPPDVAHLNDSDLTRFHELVSSNSAARQRLCDLLAIDPDTSASDVVSRAEARAEQLWGLYSADRAQHPELALLFESVYLRQQAATLKLNLLREFLRREYQVEAEVYASLPAAAGALSNCIVAFIDFFLTAGMSADSAIATHRAFGEEYRRRFSDGTTHWPKIVFLVSSQLPGPVRLQEFREAVGIRSAFFSPIRKGDITDDSLRSRLNAWSLNYLGAAQLDRYLSKMGEGVQASATSLIQDLDRLELQDLTMLATLKLAAERESLQGYLTWLLSESIAARIRSSPSLQTQLIPKQNDLALLDGKLLPSSVLFELFSAIAVAPIQGDDAKPAFGDIYAVIQQAENRTDELLLAITPACDLIRCAMDDSVLCVRGSLAKADRSLEGLLQKKSLFGKGSHVISYKTAEGTRYAHIEWRLKKGLISVPVRALMCELNFKKIARLSELFAQEVKELALADLSRVGTPVDPMFVVAGNVVVRLNLNVGRGVEPVTVEHDLADKPFISAVITRGRLEESGETTAEPEDREFLVVTQQFVDWIRQEFLPEVKEKCPAPNGKLQQLEVFFAQWSTWNIMLNENRSKSECGGTLLFKYGKIEGACTSNRMEIIVSGQ